MNKQMLLSTSIVADIREPDYILDNLRKYENIIITNLGVADYVIGDIAIERKTYSDFESSIIDGRLFRQSKELAETYNKALIIIEGREIERINKKAYYGAIASILLNNISIINVESWNDTVELIIAINRNMQKEEEHFSYIVKKKKPLTIEEQKIFLLSSIKNIGEKRAKTILDKFKTLKNLVNAQKEELESLVGKKIADKLYDIFNK